jgi:hypothetical protein
MCTAIAVVAIPLGAEAQPTSAARGNYTGPGACAASSCHGSIRPVANARILQTEYNTWAVQDRHAKATEVLTNAVSVRIARVLGLPRPDTAPRCLACHALQVPETERGKTFASEGVSCEACHGPASLWLGPHTTRTWTHAQSLALGMYDTKDLVKRVERCASCHIGAADRAVDHEMIAAGHPDLVFDLEAFSAAMPRHWQEPVAADPWIGVRAWAVGQLTELREGLERLARRARSDVWPEYSELDCFSCHHSLTRPEESWRQELGYRDRRPGNPPWNRSRAIIARLVARDVDPTAADQLDGAIGRLAQETARLQTDRGRVADLATTAAAALDPLARRAATRPSDGAQALRLMRSIVDDAERISDEGERSAEQAAMSLETLFAAYSRNAHDLDDRAVRASLDALFKQLESPSAYDPRRFAALLRQAGGALRRTGH